MSIVIDVEKVGKLYRLGQVGTGTLSHDMKRWLAKTLGKEDPFAKVGSVNDRTQKAEKNEYAWALQDISFKINQGDVVGVIGRNGAGKSTLLKILSRITSPSQGVVKIKGRIASLLEVGTGFHPEMTGRENVYMNGTVLGMRKFEIDRKFDEIVEFAGVAKYIDTPVKRYSSGMMVRLGFAVAAFLEPEILIVDEVLAVGDADFQKKALGKMQDVSEGQGRTILFVSHNMNAIKSLCTSGILLKNGTIQIQSSIENVINHYLRNEGDVRVPLSERLDRKGNGKVRFTKIRFTDHNRENIDTIFTGQALHVVLEYACEVSDLNLDLLIVSISFNNELREPVSFFVSDEMSKSVVASTGRKEIELTIDRLLLRGGNYSISLFSSYASTAHSDTCDSIENAAELTVLSSDFWKKDRPIRTSKSAVMNAEYKIYT